jgi:hypothetical protein
LQEDTYSSMPLKGKKTCHPWSKLGLRDVPRILLIVVAPQRRYSLTPPAAVHTHIIASALIGIKKKAAGKKKIAAAARF